MSSYNPRYHHRRSIRLKGYNYSRAGLYFITICCQDRACRFGNIVNEHMILNEAGAMVERWYYELENKYPDKRCHAMVVMPNHFHCIIENVDICDDDGDERNDGNGHDGDERDGDDHVGDAHGGASLRGRPVRERGRPGRPVSVIGVDGQPPEKYGMHNVKFGATIGDAMDWFKTMTTNEYIRGVKTKGWKPFNRKLWQRGYYERIIRNENAYFTIVNYIIKNPSRWSGDKFGAE